ACTAVVGTIEPDDVCNLFLPAPLSQDTATPDEALPTGQMDRRKATMDRRTYARRGPNRRRAVRTYDVQGNPDVSQERIMAELDADTRNDLDSSKFAVPGKRKLPIHDAAHTKAAMGRLNQTEGL